MSVTAAALRDLHRIHQQLAELRDRLERGPKQVRARESNVAQLDARLAEAREKAKQTQMAVDRKQLDLKSGEQKVVDLRVKLNTANNNREYQALLEQIAAAEMAGSVLSDEILEGMDKVDQFVLLVKEAEKNLADGKKEMEKFGEYSLEKTSNSIVLTKFEFRRLYNFFATNNTQSVSYTLARLGEYSVTGTRFQNPFHVTLVYNEFKDVYDAKTRGILLDYDEYSLLISKSNELMECGNF